MEQEAEPPSPKCNCRMIITISEATQLVKRGEAKWIVKTRTRGVRDVPCSLCKGDLEVKNCAKCEGTGKQEESYVEDIPGTDIVYTTSTPEDIEEKKKRKWLAPKTPRVATIEKAHIERAYVYGNKDAAERINEYGRMDKEMLAGLIVGYEPEDNAKTGEGRRYDWGRKI